MESRIEMPGKVMINWEKIFSKKKKKKVITEKQLEKLLNNIDIPNHNLI